MITLLKYSFLISCSLYVYVNILKPSSVYCRFAKKLIFLFLPIILSFLTCFLHFYLAPASIPGMVLLSFGAFTVIFCIPWKVSASATLLSYGCSYLFFTLNAFILSAMEILMIKKFNYYPPKLLLTLALGVMMLLEAVILFRARRLSRGLPFLWELGNGYTGTFISIAILTAISFLSLNNDLHFIYFVLIFSVVIWGITLLFWWKERITKKYLDQVNTRAAHDLEETISAKDSEIEYLKKQNNALAKMIHKDNKLIPAMEYSVRKLFRSAESSENIPFREEALKLLKELEQIFQDRCGLLRDYELTGKQLPSTRIVSIDILLAYMLQRSAKQNISFDVIIPEDIQSVTKRVNREDLRTLLADLLENALIAASESEQKKVLLIMENKDGAYTVDVYDSGPSFSREVLSNFGFRPVTTHKSSGGSGIGLMTISELCTKHHAAFTVEELTENHSYRKKVSVCFTPDTSPPSCPQWVPSHS